MALLRSLYQWPLKLDRSETSRIENKRRQPNRARNQKLARAGGSKSESLATGGSQRE